VLQELSVKTMWKRPAGDHAASDDARDPTSESGRGGSHESYDRRLLGKSQVHSDLTQEFNAEIARYSLENAKGKPAPSAFFVSFVVKILRSFDHDDF